MFTIKNSRKHFSGAVKNALLRSDNATIMALLRGHQAAEICDYIGTTLLHLTCVDDNYELSEELIGAGCEVNAQDHRGLTPLAVAVLYGSTQSVELLLEAGADMHLKDYRDRSPLETVADISRLGNIEWNPLQTAILDDIGSKSDRTNGSSAALMVPLFINAMRRNLINSKDIAQLLLDAEWPLYLGVLTSDIEVTRTMLDSGSCRINASSRLDGLTALHRAVNINDVNQVKMLLEYGANVNTQNMEGLVPLHNCWRIQKSAEILDLLLAAGTRLEKCNVYGRMQSHFICQYGCRADLQVLLKHKVDLMAMDEHGKTPLHYLAINWNDGVFELFREIDLIDVNVRDASGRSPMHRAAKHANYGYVELLLKKNADVNAEDNMGYTPLDLTATRRYSIVNRRKIAALLLKYGASIKRNCLVEAMYYENYETVIQPALEHLARIEIEVDAGMTPRINTIHDDHRDFIANHEIVRNYYNWCKEQLEAMRNLRVHKRVTFFDLLTASINRIAMLVRNPALIDAFERANLTEMFPTYCEILKEQFSKGVERKRLTQITAVFFSSCVKIIGPDHIVMEKILSYLSIEDMQELTKDFDGTS